MGRISVLLLLAATALACGDDEPVPGFRDECAHAGGTLLGCDEDPIENARDACWKLVECAALPVEADGADDWGNCVRRLEGFIPEREQLVIQCIDAASCDDLKAGLCDEYGDES